LRGRALRTWRLPLPSPTGESNHNMLQALRSTRVCAPGGLRPGTLLFEDEKILDLLGWNEAPAGAALRDVGDLVLLPGLVDTHVHINEPGRTEWEGFETATKAAASGGVTTLVDMPLNCVPETISAEALQAKRRAAEGRTWVDWATWGGVVRGNADSLPGLIAAGVLGFKCFLIDSGVPGFTWVDEQDLRLALEKLRGTGLPLLVHAEISGPVEEAVKTLNLNGADWRKYSTHLASRPDAAELDAISLLLRLAEEFEAPIHIVHLSTARALPMLAGARSRGTPITVETCAHYLWFCSEEIPDGATEYKCAPPIRDAKNREKLWQGLIDGPIDMITTDHSPCPPAMKCKDPGGPDFGRFDKAWGGIASLGLALSVVWTGMRQRGIGIEKIADWMAAAPARLASLTGRKGALAAGADADFVVFDPDAEFTVASADLRFRHKLSPYIGARLRGRVRETWLRGRPIFIQGEVAGPPRGVEQPRSQPSVAQVRP
jgi:allantoinase